MKTRLFPRLGGRLSVFATVMMAEGTGLESNLLQSNLLILIYLCIASPAALLAHPRPTYVAKTTII